MARPKRARLPEGEFSDEQYAVGARGLARRLAMLARVCCGWDAGGTERQKFDALPDGKSQWDFAAEAAIEHGGPHRLRAEMGPPFRNQ
ncbi:MAG: hypothetical protein HY827_10295 [Actinobacteria bacterium]|nr:hypothetical protein [Actinomycetota bacterium]